jgi:hypothetical protein
MLYGLLFSLERKPFLSNRWYLLLGMLTTAVLPLFFYTKITIVDANPVDFNWSQIPLIPQLNKRHLKSIGI